MSKYIFMSSKNGFQLRMVRDIGQVVFSRAQSKPEISFENVRRVQFKKVKKRNPLNCDDVESQEV
jgi:hypothetical protein